MRDKKKAKSEKSPDQEALEKHVDAMMDPKQPDEPAISAVTAPVSEGPTTAPQLSAKLRKQIAVTEAPSKPLSIDKLDELAKSITEPDKPKKSKKSKKNNGPPKEPQVPDVPEEPAPDIAENSMKLDDVQTDEAVDDIVAYEGDVMLAVADSTAEAHNRQFAEAEPEHHHLFSDVMWALVALVAVLIVILSALLVMGDSLANKLGL